jgi:hypothetical protein
MLAIKPGRGEQRPYGFGLFAEILGAASGAQSVALFFLGF